jgi:glycosyltransferase involved in cell wall biosynthesis
MTGKEDPKTTIETPASREAANTASLAKPQLPVFPDSGEIGDDVQGKVAIAADPDRFKDPEIEEYLAESLTGEERLSTPINPNCKVIVVIPAYGEREYLFKNLASLARQKHVDSSDFEVIVVVNNPPTAPQRASNESDDDYKRKIDHYLKSIQNNQDTLEIARAIKDPLIPIKLNAAERGYVNKIRNAGLNFHFIDKASEGKTLPAQQANVGGARNRGVAEAVARFYEYGKDGIIAQTDADAAFYSNYIDEIIKAYAQDQDLVGIAGKMKFDGDIASPQDVAYRVLTELVDSYDGLNYRYENLVKKLTKRVDGKLKTEQVSFSGANMSSRAFAAARVGGVPKIAGGEDPAFGEALARIGRIGKNNRIITRPANRFSARTAVEAGHGQKRIKFAEQIAQGKVKFKTITQLEYEYNLQRVIEAVGKRNLSPEVLKKLITVNGLSLLAEDEIAYVCEQARQKNVLDSKVLSEDHRLATIQDKILQGFSQNQEAPLDVAFSQLEERFYKEYPELKQRYLDLLEDTALDVSRFGFVLEELPALFSEGTEAYNSREAFLTALQMVNPTRYSELSSGPTKWENSFFIGSIVEKLSNVSNGQKATYTLEKSFSGMAELVKSPVSEQIIKIWMMQQLIPELS